MKTGKCRFALFFILLSLNIHAQEKQSFKDSSIIFKVFGVCEQCKDRIEEAAGGKGVKLSVWDIDTKELTLVYNATQTSLNKIQNRIVSAGHDLEMKKAKSVVYNELPKCCHYREMETMTGKKKIDTLSLNADSAVVSTSTDPLQSISHTIKGIVLESGKKGIFNPLSGASVQWLGTKDGTIADSIGSFRILYNGTSNRLVISYAGYKPDTITVTEFEELKIILASGDQLSEVKVASKQRSTYLSGINPIRTQIMTDNELFKAACCNLSESFETNPSVDVNYNDAITGSKQIQLLGLSGNYTQLTVENLPGPRGIATPLGLNSIAGPWVESIQLTKGIGSVANGYESIAGQINVELKKPEVSEQLLANAYINDLQDRFEFEPVKKIGKKWAMGLLLHDDFLTNKHLDFNDDGFRDLPTGNQLSLISRWKYDDGKGFLTQFGLKVLDDSRTGGEVGFNPVHDQNTMNKYGLAIDTKRYETFAKIGYVFPAKKYKSIGLQLSGIVHKQDSYFGLTTYDAKQQTVYANLIYQSIINTTAHKFRTGISFLYDKYNEAFRSTNYNRKEIVSGGFFEYTYTPSEKITLVAGLRGDYNNLFGFFATPRLHFRYEPTKLTTIRISVGRGQRTANIFAENAGVFVSSRQVNILDPVPGKAYGLEPEVAWNKGISFDQKLRVFHHDGLFSIDFFRNDFNNQVVVDLENAREVRFYNLRGKSYSNSFQAELNIEPLNRLNVRLAYRYFDVKTTYSDRLLQRPFISKNRSFANLAYGINGWKLDYTISYNDRKRLPDTKTNPTVYEKKNYSPGFVLMNAQLSRTVGKKHPMDIYFGGENLTSYSQKDAIVASDQPFGPYFDASMVWGPITGRLFYLGGRYRIK